MLPSVQLLFNKTTIAPTALACIVLAFAPNLWSPGELQQKISAVSKGMFVMAADFDEPLDDFKRQTL